MFVGLRAGVSDWVVRGGAKSDWVRLFTLDGCALYAGSNTLGTRRSQWAWIILNLIG